MAVAVFRADAGITIGAGHVMRCLSLANALNNEGWECGFVCSDETLATVPVLGNSKHKTIVLEKNQIEAPLIVQAHWPDGVQLLIIDHYQLDIEYEAACRPWAKHILIIDDLANRPHDADFLLDQTLDRQAQDYQGLLEASCKLLLGTEFALLRPEFALARDDVLLARSERKACLQLLISLGATDPENITSLVLEAIKNSQLPLKVDIVLGTSAPHRAQVSQQISKMSQECHLVIDPDIKKIIELMHADIAIGAGGISSWERCCLGLPTLLLIVAENQRANAAALDASGSVTIINNIENRIGVNLLRELEEIVRSPDKLKTMSENAASLCDGLGTNRVIKAVIN